MPIVLDGTAGITYPAGSVGTVAAPGDAQTWQTVTRTSGTTYTNTTGKPIVGNYSVSASGASYACTASINGGTAFIISQCALPSGFAIGAGSIIIPPGATYVITTSSGSISGATELR
jgi:hypothetical protein